MVYLLLVDSKIKYTDGNFLNERNCRNEKLTVDVFVLSFYIYFIERYLLTLDGGKCFKELQIVLKRENGSAGCRVSDPLQIMHASSHLTPQG